jgi:hypothetical protein
MSNPLPQQKDPPFSPAPMAGSNQWINNLSADNRSQLFAGQARDVYFDRRESEPCFVSYGRGTARS